MSLRNGSGPTTPSKKPDIEVGNVIVLPQLRLAAGNSWNDEAPVIVDADGNPSSVIPTEGAHPCIGHWHVHIGQSLLTFGPIIGPDRLIAIYFDESDFSAVSEVLVAYGHEPMIQVEDDWKRVLSTQEFSFLTEQELKRAMARHFVKSNPLLGMMMMVNGIDPEDLVDILMNTGNDSEARGAALRELLGLSEDDVANDDDTDDFRGIEHLFGDDRDGVSVIRIN